MRNLTPALLAHLAKPTVTLATCLEITCTNGQVFRLTDHSEAIGDYEPGLMFRPMTMESSSTVSADNTECECLTNDVLNRADIDAGLLTDAVVKAKLVNYTNPGEGDLASRRGYVGEVRTDISGLKFTVEIVGLTDKLAGTITEQYTQTCRASLGDERCQFDLESIAVSGTVEGITPDGIVISDSARTEEAGWFAFGRVVFNTGEAAGKQREVVASNKGMFALVQQMPKPVAVGDTYTLYPGCNRRLATCRVKFHNAINFRGEPLVPDPNTTFRPIS